MHTTEPGLTVGIKQIKCLPSALSMMQGQSTVDSAEVGNSKLLRRAVPQTQNTFGRAAYYCLDEADLSEILDSDQPALRLYLKGIFQAAAGCCCMNWLLQPEMTLSYPAIQNAEIQAHLGLGMSQSVFDQYVFA